MTTSATKEDLDLRKIKRETTKATEQITKTTFKVFGLLEDPPTFSEQRYVHLKRIVQKLSRTRRSVDMINNLLEVIFVTSDADSLENNLEK